MIYMNIQKLLAAILTGVLLSVSPPELLEQWFSNFLHQVPPQKIFGFPSTTIMTNIKMQYKWLLTAPGVCSRCVCVCSLLCVCALWMG